MQRFLGLLASLLVVPILCASPGAAAPAGPAPVPGAAAAGTRADAQAESWEVSSPSREVAAVLERTPSDGRLSLTVLRGGDRVATSPLGVETDRADLSRGLRLTGLRRGQVHEEYDTVVGKRRDHRDQGNQLTAGFETAAGDKLKVQVRAFDDGIGYRYVLPGAGEVEITGERSGFRLPSANAAWLMEHRANYENQYQRHRLGEVEAVPYAFPALFQLPGDTWAMLTEADVDGRYAASHLVPTGRPGGFDVSLPEDGVTSTLPSSTPWRVAVVGDVSTVVESDLVTDLASDSRVSETDWIRPGTVAWSWWSDGSSPRSFSRQKDYVDHAAEEGWEYVLVDEGWSPEWMPELVSYARARGVDVLVWARWNDLETEAERETLLPRWKSWGVKGVKLDFMNSDSQARMRWYDDVLHDTAAEKLMVNLHGSTAPRGIERTWPHVLTTEGVRGGEDYHLGQVTPQHNVALAFTRNVVGSMDYTPLTFSANRRETSAGHELALSVVYESGWLHPADSAESYDSRGVAEAVLRRMPTTWDRTELLSGTPDAAATFARQSGERWFVGSAHTGRPDTTPVPLDFLERGRPYVAEVVRDAGHDDLEVERRRVTSSDSLSVGTARNGGFVVLLCPAAEGTCLDDRLLSTVRLDAEHRWPEPGSTVPVTARVENDTSQAMRDVRAGLSLPGGWTGEPTGSTRLPIVAPGGTATFTWKVTVPESASPGSRHDLRADVRHAAGGERETVDRTAVRRVTIAPGDAPSGSPYLSDLPAYDSFNWVGPLERDQSNGGSEAGDGSALTIGGRTFAKGLGGHAHSEQVFHLGKGCSRLNGHVGVDDAVGDKGSVSFQVWGDDRLLFDSGPMTGGDPAREMAVPLGGVEELRLVLADGGDFVADDHGDWAAARLAC